MLVGTLNVPDASPRRLAATLPPGRAASSIKPETVAAASIAEHHERLRNLTREDLQAAALALRETSKASNNCVTLATGILEFLQTGATPKTADPRKNTHEDFAVEAMLGPQQPLIKQELDKEIDDQRPHHIMTSMVVHHGDRLAGFIPADPLCFDAVNSDTVQMLDHVVYEVDRYSQPFMQFNEASANLRELARRCARADQGQGSPAIYGLINLGAVAANTAGHQLAYFARPDEVMFIDCQSIRSGKGQAVQPTLDALFDFGQTGAPAEFQSKIFVTPSYPFVAAQTLREVLNGSPQRRDAPGSAAAMSTRSPLAAAPTPAPIPVPQQPVGAMNPVGPVGMFPLVAPANDRNTSLPKAAEPARSAVLAPPVGNLPAPPVPPSLNAWQMQRLVQKFGPGKALQMARHCGPALMAPPPLGLGMPMDKILTIGSFPGDEFSLAAVSEHAPALRALELPLDDIVKVASATWNGANAIKALVAHAPALRAVGMSLDDVIKLATKDRAEEVLKAVATHARALLALQMSLDDVIRLADNTGVEAVLTAVTREAPALLALDISFNDIINVLADCRSDPRILEEMRQHTPALRTLGLPLEVVVQIAASSRNSLGSDVHILEAVNNHAPALRTLGLELHHIAEIACYSNSHGLAEVIIHAPALLVRKVTPDDIVEIVALNGRRNVSQTGLNIMKHQAHQLLDLGLTVDQIVKIVRANDRFSAQSQLQAVLKHARPLLDMKLTCDDIVAIAVSDEKFSARLRLQSMRDHVPALLELKLPLVEIVRLVTNTRDSSVLNEIVKHAEALGQLGLTIAEITSVALHEGASKTLSVMATTTELARLRKADLLAMACRPNGYKELLKTLKA